MRCPFFKPSLTGLDVSSEEGNDGRGCVDVMEPGAAIGRDIAKGEAVEAEIDAFISRRDAQRRKSEPERETEASWKAAEKLQEAARRRENRAGCTGGTCTGRSSTGDCRRSTRPRRRA